MSTEVVYQPFELVRFVSNINTFSDGTIPFNILDDEVDDSFQSRYYTPTYAISSLARHVQQKLSRGLIQEERRNLDSSSLVYKVNRTDLSTHASNIYLLVRIVMLESFSLIYAIENDRVSLRYIFERDIARTKENINYIADYLSTQEKYHHLIEDFRNLNLTLGYLEHQTKLIMESRER